MENNNRWDISDLGNAMRNAVLRHANPRFLREQSEKILFNGFWRDGSKQNVCIWPKTATWKDLKTDLGGGCKDFAEQIFNLTLKEFMEQYGTALITFKTQPAFNRPKASEPIIPLNIVWKKISKAKDQESQNVDRYFSQRGFKDPHKFIGSGFTELASSNCEYFEQPQKNFLQERLKQGHQLLVPLRGIKSDEIKNIFVRALNPQSQEQKSRVLPGYGGWSDEDNNPLAFGFPHLFRDYNHILLFEGMADYFAGEFLLDHDHKYLPLGVPSASFLTKWAHLLAENKYSGQVTIVYQLDRNNGQFNIDAVGAKFGTEAIKILKNNNCKSKAFDWVSFLEKLCHQIEMKNIKDIADICQAQVSQNLSHYLISQTFLEVLNAG